MNSYREKNILLALLIITSFNKLFFSWLSISILGISFYLILFIVTIFSIFLSKIKAYRKSDIYIYLVLIVSLFFVKFSRDILYPSSRGYISEILYSFPIYLIPVFLLIFSKIDKEFIKRLRTILLWLLIIQAFLATMFMLHLPTVNLIGENAPINYIRYAGIMGAANMNSDFNALIVSILILGSSNYSFTQKVLIVMIGGISVVPSFSRTAMGIILMIFVYIIFTTLKRKLRVLFWIILPIFILLSYVVIRSNMETLQEVRSFSRITTTIENKGLDPNREAKNQLAYSLLTDNLSYFVFGAPVKKQIDGSISVSDNSVLQNSLVNGAPFMIFFFLVIIKISNLRVQINSDVILYLLIITLTVFVNNALYWIPWIYLVSIGYWSISNKGKMRLNVT